MNKEIKKENLWCEYSDLPSPMAYINFKNQNVITPQKKRNKKEISLKLITLFKKKYKTY